MGLWWFLRYCISNLIQRTDTLEKILIEGKDGRQEEKGMTEDEMIGWHHRLHGHEFEQALEDGGGKSKCRRTSWVSGLVREGDGEWRDWQTPELTMEVTRHRED